MKKKLLYLNQIFSNVSVSNCFSTEASKFRLFIGKLVNLKFIWRKCVIVHLWNFSQCINFNRRGWGPREGIAWHDKLRLKIIFMSIYPWLRANQFKRKNVWTWSVKIPQKHSPSLDSNLQGFSQYFLKRLNFRLEVF